MGWKHIPDKATTTATSDDNPFPGPKLQLIGEVSKAAKSLNVTSLEVYLSLVLRLVAY